MKYLAVAKRCALSSVFILLLQSATFEALAHQVKSPPSPMMSSGPDMMGGIGVMDSMMGTPQLINQLYALDVSAEQKQNINQAQDELREAQWALMPQAMEKRKKLQSAMADKDADPALIGRLFSELSDVHRQLLERQVVTQNQLKSILTEEQREQFRKFHQASLSTVKGHGMFMNSIYRERARLQMDRMQRGSDK